MMLAYLASYIVVLLSYKTCKIKANEKYILNFELAYELNDSVDRFIRSLLF